MGTRLIAMSDEKAAILEKLLEAFGPIIDDLKSVTAATLGLRLADGSTRTVKIFQTTIEDSAPSTQPGDGIPTGWSEEVVTFYEGEECTEVTRTLLVKD